MHIFSISAHSIQYQKTRRGIAYQAQLLRDGIPVGTVYNDGHGGDTAVSDITKSHYTALLDEALGNGHVDASYLSCCALPPPQQAMANETSRATRRFPHVSANGIIVWIQRPLEDERQLPPRDFGTRWNLWEL